MTELTASAAASSSRSARGGVNKDRLTTALIIGITLAFIGGVSLFTIRHEQRSQQEIAGPSKELAAAMQANDPSAAPPGGRGYVKGVREHFGRIREARFLDAYTARYGSGRSAQTDTVSEIYVRGKRGAGVLELDFDGPRIQSMREVEPGDVHSDLRQAEEDAVERGFARRGGETANITVLDGTFTRDEIAAAN